MDTPEYEGDELFLAKKLESLPDESPSNNARLRIEKEGAAVDLVVPPIQAFNLLDTAVSAVVTVAAVAAPALTLKALPAGFPVWATVGLISAQLAITMIIRARTFTKKPVLDLGGAG